MMRAFLILFNMYSATKKADAYEARYGLRGRLRILVSLPAQTASTFVFTQLTLRTIGPIRKLLGKPTSPTAERVAALWTTLLLENRLPGQFAGAGLSLSTMDGFANARVDTWGSAPFREAAEALDEKQLRAALAHEIAHLRFAHLMIISFATAALAAGWPLVVRRLMGVEIPKLADSKSPRRHPRPMARSRRSRRSDSFDAFFERYEHKKAVRTAASTPRARAATTVAVLSAAAALAALQRACEFGADDYAARVAGSENLASAIAGIEAVETKRNARPGRKAAFWRADARASQTMLALFASAPSPAARIARLRRRAATR
jgi:hypothetical protein